MADKLRVGLIGYKFMGRAHTNAWSQAPRFFDLPMDVECSVVCGRDEQAVGEFAKEWGWAEAETDWRKVVERDDIDVVDVSLPQALHHDVAVAAMENGKHVFCEKPMANSLADAANMRDVAHKTGVVHYVNHNYRRCPAVSLARQMIDEGLVGRIFHWRGAYQQDWIVDPDFPITWHLQKEHAGSGPHGDLNSHSVDLAHYLVGDITNVSCLTKSFITERPVVEGNLGTFSTSRAGGETKMGKVTVEDASIMNVEFDNGAVGTFEATRFAPGRKNHNCFEIYGSEGSICFDLERMNELEYFSRNDPENAQGFRRIIATESCHPYVGQWWPPGHIIGYEHGFVHAVADVVKAVAGGDPIRPNFDDGLRTIAVLDAGLKSAAEESRRIAVEVPS